MDAERKRQGKLIVFSAPSGTGKSTIAKHLLERIPEIRFSVSATTREKRVGEVEGINYYFLSRDEFEKKIQSGGFIEHEFFFGNHYGTLFDKTSEAIENGTDLLLDLDVKGALNLKRLFPENSLLIFFRPPGMDVLEARLKGRESENEASLAVRLERARLELEYADRFDEVIVNDNLELAVESVTEKVRKFLL